jgi:galactokinase
VENRVVGAPCGIMDQVSACAGESGTLLRLLCQPHELQPPLIMPKGIRAVGINSNVKHSVGGGMYGKTRCAAFMGHRIILEMMRKTGVAGPDADPMNGYLANLDSETYKKLYRPRMAEYMMGSDFLRTYGGTIDKATTVDPNFMYHIVPATDHHVFEALRVRNFVEYLEAASQSGIDSDERTGLLNMAGHLMYSSHLSYTNFAKLGADECDLLVKLAREREHLGLYGAKITGGGSGGTVAILCNEGEAVDDVLHEIMSLYQKQTGHRPEAFFGTSPGAWTLGTTVVTV